MGIVSATNWTTRSQKYNETTPYPYAVSAENNWSTFLKNNGIVENGTYTFDVIFEDSGKQKFQTSADGDAYFYIDGVFEFKLSSESTSPTTTTNNLYEKDKVYRITIVANNTDRGLTAVAAKWVGYVYDYVAINSFTSTQFVESGNPLIPTSKVSLSWDIDNAKQILIDNNIGDVSGFASKTIDTYLQSKYPENSPATKIYTITAVGYVPTDIQTKTLTVSISNDNEFEYFEQGSSTFYEIPSFLDIDSDDEEVRLLGSIYGIDMRTSVSSPNGDFTIAIQNSPDSFSTSTTVDPGDQVYIKISAPPFSTDEFGEPNITQYVIDIGPIRKKFNVGRRAPSVRAVDFDAPDVTETFPYPDIDTVEGNPTEYLVTSISSIDTETIELVTPNGPQVRTNIKEFSEGHITSPVKVRVIPPGTTESQKQLIPFVEPNNFYEDDPNERRILKDMNVSSITLRAGTTHSPANPNRIRIRQGNVITAYNVLE